MVIERLKRSEDWNIWDENIQAKFSRLLTCFKDNFKLLSLLLYLITRE